MAAEMNQHSIAGQVDMMGGALRDVATVKAMLDEHARLSSCLKNRIAALPAVEQDLWVGMGSDEFLVSGESLFDVMDRLAERGVADGTVVVEFLSPNPRTLVL